MAAVNENFVFYFLQTLKSFKINRFSKLLSIFKSKNFFLFVFFLIASFSFSSCKKESTTINKESQLIGKWQLTETSESDTEPCDYKGWLSFFKDHKYKEYDACYGDTDSGAWEFKNDAIIVTANDFPVPISLKVITLNKTTLIISGFGARVTYIRLE